MLLSPPAPVPAPLRGDAPWPCPALSRRGRTPHRASRLEGICTAAGINLAELDVQMIAAPTPRLDLEVGRICIDKTVARLQPRLLVLDPFVHLGWLPVLPGAPPRSGVRFARVLGGRNHMEENENLERRFVRRPERYIRCLRDRDTAVGRCENGLIH